jgi:hypothetical protein
MSFGTLYRVTVVRTDILEEHIIHMFLQNIGSNYSHMVQSPKRHPSLISQ